MLPRSFLPADFGLLVQLTKTPSCSFGEASEPIRMHQIVARIRVWLIMTRYIYWYMFDKVAVSSCSCFFWPFYPITAWIFGSDQTTLHHCFFLLFFFTKLCYKFFLDYSCFPTFSSKLKCELISKSMYDLLKLPLCNGQLPELTPLVAKVYWKTQNFPIVPAWSIVCTVHP